MLAGGGGGDGGDVAPVIVPVPVPVPVPATASASALAPDVAGPGGRYRYLWEYVVYGQRALGNREVREVVMT